MSRKSGALEEEVVRYLARCARQGSCLVGPHVRYGCIRYGRRFQIAAHRASYIVHNGPIPDGLVVRHTCDNPRCVEPTHLLVGTAADNEQDKVRRGRKAFGLAVPNATIAPDRIIAALTAYLNGDGTQASWAEQLGVAQSTFGRWVRAEARRDTDHAGVRIGKGRRPVERWIGGDR